MKALIVAGGAPPRPELLSRICEDCELCVAADRGAEAFLAAGLVPDLLIGDLDSAAERTADQIRALGAEVVKVPREKDETDLELAARTVFERGAEDVVILGATGGRVDHLLGNLAVLRWFRSRGVSAEIQDSMQSVRIVDGCGSFPAAPGETVSILPAGEAATVSASGLRYPLRELKLHSDTARGVSNVTTGDVFTLETRGPVFLVRSFSV
ncbi:MAG: thiamine diphosphokinase [Clostridia bacterium]|nr:thiamine diphosphokinase [Clostridia bacterium]